MSQLTRILQYAENNLGTSRFHGKCQAFVASCYEAGTGVFISCASAKISRQRYMREGTAKDLYPPAGAAVYFNGDGAMGKLYGHVALSVGGGMLYDPVATVVKCRLSQSMHNGYLGWGWLGSMPEGAQTTYPQTSPSDSSRQEPVRQEITRVVLKSETGAGGKREGDLLRGAAAGEGISLLLQNGGRIFAPVTVDRVRWTTTRAASAAVLRFSLWEDDQLPLENGCPVAFRYQGTPVFYGYVFEIARNSGGKTDVTCYDQLRYFKNKETMVYELKYSDLLRQVAAKYGMRTGTIEDTGYLIPARMEEASLLDVFETAAELTAQETGGFYQLYDQFGELNLRAVGKNRTSQVISEQSAASFSLRRSIDRDVYTQVLLARDNSLTGERELYAAADAQAQSRWGMLQYYERAEEAYSPAALKQRAQTLLRAYASENRSLSVKGALGDPAVRGGCLVPVRLPGDKTARTALCESAVHTFGENRHTMDLELSGNFAKGENEND